MMVSDLPKPTREYRFHDTRKWRLDFAWPDYKLAVEIDGGVHGIREKRGRDAEKSRALNDAEWRVQRYTSEDIRDMPVQVIEEVARILRERMTINSERKN
jgi:very-short-patch-repair endonuclease